MLQESSSLAAILGRDSTVANRIIRLVHDKFHLPHDAAFEGIPATAKSLWDSFSKAGKIGVLVCEKGIAVLRGQYSGYFVLGFVGNKPTEKSVTIKVIGGSIDQIAAFFGQPLHAFISDDETDENKPTYWGAASHRNDPDDEGDFDDFEFDWYELIDSLIERTAPIMLRKIDHKIADMNGFAAHMLKVHNFKRAQALASQLHDLKKMRIQLEHPANTSSGDMVWACANMALARSLKTVIKGHKGYASAVEHTIGYRLDDHRPYDYDIVDSLTDEWGPEMAQFAKQFLKATPLTGAFMKEFEKALFADYTMEEDD